MALSVSLVISIYIFHGAKCSSVNTGICLHIYVIGWVGGVCVGALYSPTFGDPSARHLEPPLPLSLTHRIYLHYPPPPSLPERCHSQTRLTADIIKAVWPPDMLLAQSRNADRHRATWALAQECPVWVIVSVCAHLFVNLPSWIFNKMQISY